MVAGLTVRNDLHPGSGFGQRRSRGAWAHGHKITPLDAKALGQPPAIHNLEKRRGILLLSMKHGLS